MRKKLFTWMCLLAMLLVGADAMAADKPVMQQTDATQADTYLSNRRALVGRHCVVNKLIDVVGVGSWVKDLNNLTDEDLSNVTTFPKIVDATVAVSPIVSIRDMKHHYAAGTTAGFTLVASSGSSLLSLNIINAFAISFYCEGKLVGTKAVQEGQDVGGVGLSLITIPGSSDVSIDLAAEAPAEFDEISLVPSGGVDLSAVTSTKVKYAFVGNLVKHTITKTSMENYAASHGRLPFTLDQGGWPGSDIINDDLTDGVAWGVLSIGSSLIARVGATIDREDPDQSQPFKKGATVGFVYGNGSILKLNAGDAVKIELFKGEWVEKERGLINKTTYYEWEETEVQSETVSATVVGLNIIKGGKQQITITAKEDFCRARITFPTAVGLDLGGTKVYYAFVCDPPEADHQCDIQINAPVSICDTQTSFQMDNSGTVDVEWTIESQPGSATIDETTGLITGMTVNGQYIVRATSTVDETCYQETVITRGIESTDDMCDSPLYNVGDEQTYVLSTSTHGEDGTLLSVAEAVTDPENILNPQFGDYATYTGGVRLVDNTMIVGVRKTAGLISDGSKAHRIGFVVETKSTGLGLNLLDMFNIRAFKNGAKVYSAAVKENNVLGLGLIGSSKVQKIRFAITVPEGTSFDEFQLFISGALDVQLSKLNIYYAFDEVVGEGESELSSCADPLGCSGNLVSNTATNATINGNETRNIEVLSVANVTDNLSYLIDDDIETAVTIARTVSAGGTKLAIDLGRVYTPQQQVGIIMDNATFLAQVKVGGWLTIETYRNGEATGDKHSDWSVAGANVIGYGDKSFLFMQPTKDYDEVRITLAGIVEALNYTKIYGLFVRNDADGDGVPDCMDAYSCSDELVLDEEATVMEKDHDYTAAHLVLHRSLTKSVWSPLVLPVDLNGLQVRNAFGNGVKIATPNELIVGETNTINFKSLAIDNSVVLKKGEFYLISTAKDADLSATESYESLHDGTVNGPIFFIEGVDYATAMNNAAVPDAFITQTKKNAPAAGSLRADATSQQVNIKGSYVHLDGDVNAKVKAKNYLYREDGSLWIIDEESPMLGFRFYIEDLTTNGKNIDYSIDGTVTGITQIAAEQVNGVLDHNVYTLDGRSLGEVDDLTTLPAGIYIVKGRKTLVK